MTQFKIGDKVKVYPKESTEFIGTITGIKTYPHNIDQYFVTEDGFYSCHNESPFTFSQMELTKISECDELKIYNDALADLKKRQDEKIKMLEFKHEARNKILDAHLKRIEEIEKNINTLRAPISYFGDRQINETLCMDKFSPILLPRSGTFVSVLPALKDGKKIRRKSWEKKYYIQHSNESSYQLWGIISVDNLVADDWEIMQ